MSKTPVILDALWCADGVWRVPDLDASKWRLYEEEVKRVVFNPVQGNPMNDADRLSEILKMKLPLFDPAFLEELRKLRDIR